MRLALRIDDIGASSKKYEVYSNRGYGLCNILFLKYLSSFRAWGPYRELTAREWESVFEVLKRYNARLTVAITSCWVDFYGKLIPFPLKFPDQAKKIKQGLLSGLLEIANHGLTHCVTDKLRFRPRLFTSNRKYHREFWEWIPEREHFRHIRDSQEVLQDYFETKIVTFVPPGNVYTDATLRACVKNGIRIINCNTGTKNMKGVKILGNERTIDFHDREIVLKGVQWLEGKLNNMPKRTEYIFVKDL